MERYIDANVARRAEVVERTRPDVALANHLVMGPVILARALEGRVPYAVKVHGSALEYTVRPHRERFLPYALEGVRGASGVLVGSRHTAESLWEVHGRARAARAHPAGAARGGRAHLPAAAARRRRPPGSGGWPGGSRRARRPRGAERRTRRRRWRSLDPAATGS